MGNACLSATDADTDTVELLHKPQILWEFINPPRERQKYGHLCTHGHSQWCISFDDDVFSIYDKENDISAKAYVTNSTDDGFTLTATFDYVVRQTMYATPTVTKPRTLSFAFSLKDNVEHNATTYGWRTKVGMYEKGHLLKHYGLV